MVKLFILLANILLPLTAFFLASRYSQVPYGWLFSVSLCFHILYRVWETFFTSKERDPQKFEGDWTLAIGTLAYIGLCFLITFEFFLMPHHRFLITTVTGFVLYIIAARIRFWGVTTLGRQWAVHVVGNNKIAKSRLLQIGPYKYIRHPIYLGIMLDELTLPLIAGTYLSLICVLLINIPLLLIRLISEEKVSCQKFDDEYVKYKEKTGMIFPKSNQWQFIKELLTRLK